MDGDAEPGFYTGLERRTVLDPDLVEFVQVGGAVYRVHDALEAIAAAALEDVNRSATAGRGGYDRADASVGEMFPGFGQGDR